MHEMIYFAGFAMFKVQCLGLQYLHLTARMLSKTAQILNNSLLLLLRILEGKEWQDDQKDQTGHSFRLVNSILPGMPQYIPQKVLCNI